ncbi:MAG: 4-alpha-glucanotransferase [Deltaproteobacteria bacterium]|nr:4-alpha-glucanotransferase [Deltaproteobacteria bacterium]MDQ3296092.1 4-alpha-glucanotransferase [Myxococcota bacterium]
MSDLIDAALGELGVRRMLLAIHDVSFPSDPDEDLGRGAPSTKASARLFAYVRALGFTGLQLGPQGQTSRDNPSPYDATIFSRHTATIGVRSGAFADLVPETVLAASVLAEPGGRAQHGRAHDVTQVLLDHAHEQVRSGGRPDVAERLATFRRDHAGWLDRDALFAALGAERGGATFRTWPAVDALLWKPWPGEEASAAKRRAQLAKTHERALDRYALGQLLAHEAHAGVRARCGALGLALYGDLQVGYAESDAWSYAAAFLDDYVMGAPPSRTNPDGQPWNYPVLDPDQYAGAVRALVVARVDKAFAEYDSLRIDHPHGLVCPWVYRTDAPDPAQAVRDGARLFESPDLADHPRLARFAISRAAQLDRSRPRHADRWVRELDADQISRYAVLFEAIAETAHRHGRSRADLSCEVLSTMPLPLEHVLARYGLGRWRVTQKANLDDPTDVYRTENVAIEDWVMLGNHDTAPIFALIRSWPAAKREQWARHLVLRLALRDPARIARLATDDGFLATAMLAELFVCRAQNVSIFFADLFGYDERFNAPGTVSHENWSLRLPPDFDRLHHARLASGAALDIPLALALALEAKGSTTGLAARLAPA